MPKYLQLLYLIPLALSAMISLKTFRRSWPRAFQYFSIFLIANLLMELFAVSWKFLIHTTPWWNYAKNNMWIYNPSYLPAYLFYFFFYYKALDPGIINKTTFRVISLVFLTGAIINLFFGQGFFKTDSYTVIAGHMGVIFFSLHYFMQELQRKQPRKATSDPLFWISVGAFIFHTATLPFFVFMNYLNTTNLQLAITMIKILLILNFFMQTTYLIAFLCHNPFQKKHT